MGFCVKWNGFSVCVSVVWQNLFSNVATTHANTSYYLQFLNFFFQTKVPSEWFFQPSFDPNYSFQCLSEREFKKCGAPMRGSAFWKSRGAPSEASKVSVLALIVIFILKYIQQYIIPLHHFIYQRIHFSIHVAFKGKMI